VDIVLLANFHKDLTKTTGDEQEHSFFTLLDSPQTASVIKEEFWPHATKLYHGVQVVFDDGEDDEFPEEEDE
jgi:hypothetical protein